MDKSNSNANEFMQTIPIKLFQRLTSANINYMFASKPNCQSISAEAIGERTATALTRNSSF